MSRNVRSMGPRSRQSQGGLLPGGVNVDEDVRELERRRLEEEIKRMEAQIAQHKSGSQINIAIEEDEEEIIEEEYYDEDEGDEILEEVYDDEEEEYEEEEFEEEVVDDDGFIEEEYEEEDYEEEYIDDDDMEEEIYEEVEEEEVAPEPEKKMVMTNQLLSGMLQKRAMAPPPERPTPPVRPQPPAARAPPPPPVPPTRPTPPLGSLMDAVKGAAAVRNERLEEDPAGLKMKQYEMKEKPARPMDTFDLTAMVSKAAKEREARLEAGGKKKMTEIKSKSEYKRDFKDIASEAAQLGRLTRLNEHVVEAVAVEKTKEEEWRSKGLLAIQWRNQHMAVIHEAARAGAASRLPEKVCTNFVEEKAEEEYEDEEWEYDESKTSTRRVSERLKQILQLAKGEGGHETAQHKVDELIAERKQQKLNETRDMAIKPMIYYCEDINNVKLPRRKAPQVDPKKQLEKIQAKFRGTYQTERPLSNISNEVAERAWARRTRLDRPGSMPRVVEVCHCPYCLDPSPMQTQAYKERDKLRKQDGYESPDSEDERKKAREKRRLERRKNRGGRGGGASPGDDDEEPTAGSVSSQEEALAAPGGIRVRRSRRGTGSTSTALAEKPEPAKNTSIVSAELASMMESVAPKFRPGGAPRVRTSGRIGAAARKFSEVQRQPQQAALDGEDLEVEAYNRAMEEYNRAMEEAKAEEAKPKGRKVLRRRIKPGGAAAAGPAKPTRTLVRKVPAAAAASPASSATTSRLPLGAKVGAVEFSGGTKRLVRKKGTPDPEKEETIITRPDGTRVIRRKVKVKAPSAADGGAVVPPPSAIGSPSRVVTKKVVRTVGGGTKVTTVVDHTPATASAPAATTTTTTRGGMTRVRAVPAAAATPAPAPAVTTTTTTTRVRRSALQQQGGSARHFASTGSIPPMKSSITTSTTPASSSLTAASKPTASAPPSASAPAPPPPIGSPTKVTVTRDGPGGSRVVTTTTTTTTTAKKVPARTRSGFFGLAKRK